MERYASGEVPQVGDTVVCVDDFGSGHPPTITIGREHRINGVSDYGRYVNLDGGNFNAIYSRRFRLVRRWVDVSAIDGSGVFHVAEPKTLEGASLADALKEARAAMQAALDLLDTQRRECEEATLVPLNGRNVVIEEGPIAKSLRAAIAKLDAIGGA